MGKLLKITQVRMGGVNMPPIQKKAINIVSGYNHEKYWGRRAIVVDPKSKVPTVIRLYYLLWIKRVDAKHHCSFGTYLNAGAQFATPPILPHGPNGIIVGGDAMVGRDCVIYHQVTIVSRGVVIGDNVMLGVGSKVMQGVRIGNHCQVGANAVVVEDMPDNSTCVLQKPRIILKGNTLRNT